MRYGALRRGLSGSLGSRAITDRALTMPLRRLERDGLVVRRSEIGRPPIVAYAIAERGPAAIDGIRALWRCGFRFTAWDGGIDLPDPVAPLRAPPPTA